MTDCFGSTNRSNHSCVLATAVRSLMCKSVFACCSMMTKETTTYVCMAATDECIELEFFSLIHGGHNMKHNKLATQTICTQQHQS
jgi:hypothetical protein